VQIFAGYLKLQIKDKVILYLKCHDKKHKRTRAETKSTKFFNRDSPHDKYVVRERNIKKLLLPAYFFEFDVFFFFFQIGLSAYFLFL